MSHQVIRLRCHILVVKNNFLLNYFYQCIGSS